MWGTTGLCEVVPGIGGTDGTPTPETRGEPPETTFGEPVIITVAADDVAKN